MPNVSLCLRPPLVSASSSIRWKRRAPQQVRPSIFQPTADRVLIEQRLLTAETVWLEAGSPRHVLGLDPGVLTQLTRAIPADLTQEG